MVLFRGVHVTDARTDEPRLGFRYTHDVFLDGEWVGEATEVSERCRDCWHVFVRIFGDLPGTLTPHPSLTLGTQYLDIRTGVLKGRASDLIRKKKPVPIPGMKQPNRKARAKLRDDHPRIIAW